MSPEQFSPPEFTPPAAHDAADFEDDNQIDLHASSLVPIEVIRARQAIAAAVAATVSSAPELNQEVIREKITPQKAIANVTRHVLAMRREHGADTIDLFADDTALEADFFMPADLRPTDTQDNFGLAS